MKHVFLLIVSLFVAMHSYSQQLPADSLERIVREGNEKEKSVALYQLGLLFRHKDPEKAIRYLESALSNPEPAMQAQIQQHLGGLHFRSGNFNISKQYYLQALNYFSTSGALKQAAEVQFSLGGIYLSQGNLPVAAQNYLQALRFYETTKDNAGLVNVYTALAALYARQNHFSQSIEYNLKAIALYEQASNTLQALVGYDQIGNAYLKTENYSKAAVYFNKSLNVYRDLKNEAGEAMCLYQLGTIAYRQQRVNQAESYYKQSIQKARKLNMNPLWVSNLNALGNMMLDQNRIEEAENQFNQALKLAQKSGMKLELEEAYNGLEKIYNQRKQSGKASTFRTLSRQLKDSIYNDSALKQLSDLQLRYESEKKQRQIELLSKEQEIRESELLRIKQLNTLYTYAGLLIGISLLILVYFFLANKKYSRSLQQQKSELIIQKEKLDQLNKVKDRFFSIISHDLRNNLTTMKLYFDLISHPEYKPENNSDITRQIAGSVENTIDLLENLLVWASSQVKGVPIHIQKLSIQSLIQENMHLLGGNAAQKNIQFHNAVEDNVYAYGDMDMINLVIRNLLSNAIKFTPVSGTIEVNASTEGSQCVLQFRDNGVGISDENLKRLFDQHLHPSTKGTGNEKGTGLGLMLCKDFIEKNNGSIRVESKKDSGTTFYVSLPLVPPATV